MNIIVSHPTGNANVRAVVEAFFKAGILKEFNTTMATDPENGLLKVLPAKLRSELLRRTFPVDPKLIETYPYLEFARMVLPKLGLHRFVQGESAFAGIDAVYKNFDRQVAKHLLKSFRKNAINAVYAYEDGAIETFTQAKKLGIKCIYDLPIAYWETGRSLLEKEAERLPQWTITLGGGIKDSKEKLERKTRELELADMVVGPGSFVMDSLPVWAKDKHLVMSPFGSPQTVKNIGAGSGIKKDGINRLLRILFVGSMGQRKGLGDLFEAMKILRNPDIELVVMGSLLAPMEFYRKEFEGFTYEPGRPHDKVLELMQTCDVFCLPSIVEGRALVMQEAMSQGLPLIITTNTGGEDLIKEGETGFLVPVSSPQAIADKINWFFENRSSITLMGKKAQEHAAGYTWENYGAKIVSAVSVFNQ